MIKVMAYGQEWWAQDDWSAANPVPLYAEEQDVTPFLIVPRSVVKLLAQRTEPTEIGVPLWDEVGTVHIRNPQTGMWMSMSASGAVATAWSSLDHPVRFLQPGTVRIPEDPAFLDMMLQEIVDLARDTLSGDLPRPEALHRLRSILRRYLF